MGKHSGKQPKQKRQADDDQEWEAVLKEVKVEAAHQILITPPQSECSGCVSVWVYGWGREMIGS